MSVDTKAQASKSRSQDESSAKTPSSEDQLKIIQTVLEDAKALDVVVVDLAGKTSIADYMVVACGLRLPVRYRARFAKKALAAPGWKVCPIAIGC